MKKGIEPGIHHYAPADHALERVRGGTFGGGLGACAVGAFFDDAVNRLVEIDGADEAALVLLPVGPR